MYFWSRWVCLHFLPIHTYIFFFGGGGSIMLWCSSLCISWLKFMYFFSSGINTLHISTFFFSLPIWIKASSCPHVILSCILFCVLVYFILVLFVEVHWSLLYHCCLALKPRALNPHRVSFHLYQSGLNPRAVHGIDTAATTIEFLLLYYCCYDLAPWVS